MQHTFRIVVLALLAACLPVGIARAQEADTLRLDDALRIALEANPALRAARLRSDAAAERIAPAGALPDPMVQLGMRNWPIDLASTQGMSMQQLQFTQRFPWPGKLHYGQERATRLANASEMDADELEQNLIARVKEVYYRIGFTDRALSIMGDTRGLLRDFHQVSTAMYSVGTGLQQDVLQAQVAIASMTESITVMEQNRIAMVARLNSLLGREATVAIAAVELPDSAPEVASPDSLIRLATDTRPALRAARERVLAAEAGYNRALKEIFPDITVTLGYGNRPQFVNLATLMVGFSLPIHAGSRQRPLQREMLAMQEEAEARSLDLYNETYARLAELTAEANRARNLSELYRTSVLPQARAAVESALSAYRVGRVDYMTLIQNEMTVNRYEIESVRLRAEYNIALGRIEALIGEATGGDQ